MAPGHYAEEVRPSSSHPSMPPEALARQMRLQHLLDGMALYAPNLEPGSLQDLRAALAGQRILDVETWMRRIQTERLVEEAAELVRSTHRGVQDLNLQKEVAAILAPLAATAQAKRNSRHHLDSRRATIRFHFSKQAAAVDLDDRDLQAIFLQALRLEGLIVALDFGKRPRPLLHSPLPLPAGVAGVDEYMEVELKDEPGDGPDALMQRLQLRLPAGLSITRWEGVPRHASSLADLALASHWQWRCASSFDQRVRELAEGFRASGEGSDGFLKEMAWEEGSLTFTTRMGVHLATNPVKVLAARLGTLPSEVTGLTRLRVDLRPDPRLDQADRFEPKLKNIYEDAVLLSGDSNITLVEEDDDEPLLLG